MLHPNQFRVNEAWIAFKLNQVPVRTELDGDFNCFALMDAASCFILTMEMVPATAVELSILDARRMLKRGHAHKRELPRTLYVPTGLPADSLVKEAERQRIAVIRVAEHDLMAMIGEAREGFSERFGGDGR